MTPAPRDVFESDTPMTKTYIGVLVLEAIVVTALWIFGRMFS